MGESFFDEERLAWLQRYGIAVTHHRGVVTNAGEIRRLVEDARVSAIPVRATIQPGGVLELNLLPPECA